MVARGEGSPRRGRAIGSEPVGLRAAIAANTRRPVTAPPARGLAARPRAVAEARDEPNGATASSRQTSAKTTLGEAPSPAKTREKTKAKRKETPRTPEKKREKHCKFHEETPEEKTGQTPHIAAQNTHPQQTTPHKEVLHEYHKTYHKHVYKSSANVLQ